MKSPKEVFDSGGFNPRLGIGVRDWYAIGCEFIPPMQHEGQIITCARALVCADAASTYFMDHEIIPHSPAPVIASELITLIDRVFNKYGPPKTGVIISQSAWVSSAEMISDKDLCTRGEKLAQNDISFSEMSLLEKGRIAIWIEQHQLRCEFDANNVF